MTELATVHSEETHKSQVDTETTERFIAEKHIGERIKRLRLKKSMGLVELGRHTGLSASFLSQLETGRVVPTLRNLARIAMVFSKDLSYFFETEPQSRLPRPSPQRAGPPSPDRRRRSHIFLRESRLHGPRPPHGPLLRRVHSPREEQRAPRPTFTRATNFSTCLRANSEMRHGDRPHHA